MNKARPVLSVLSVIWLVCGKSYRDIWGDQEPIVIGDVALLTTGPTANRKGLGGWVATGHKQIKDPFVGYMYVQQGAAIWAHNDGQLPLGGI